MNVLGGILTAALAVLPSVAWAQEQQMCGPRDAVLAVYAAKWNESPVFTGVGPGGREKMETLLSPQGTWTFIMTRPNDVSCVLASGTDFMVSGDMPLTGERVSLCRGHQEEWRGLGIVTIKECGLPPR